MSPSSRRASLVAVLGALALAVPGLPAAPAEAASPVPAAMVAGAPKTTRIAGITQMDAPTPEAATGRVLFDSREAGAKTPLAARGTITLDLDSLVDVPSDATAALFMVTSVGATKAGWLTVWRADRERPAASTLNFTPGTPTVNLAAVRLGADRKLRVHNGSGGTTHDTISLRGWVRANRGGTRPGTMTPTDPMRVVDTRVARTPIPARGYRDVKVAGAGVPTGAGAALLDLVAVKPTKAGYLVAHPSDTARPTSTALTYQVGADRAALTLVRLSSTGTVRLWNMSSAPVHVVLDSFAWVAAGDTSNSPLGTQAQTPRRILDTRSAGVPLRFENSFHATVPLPAEDTSSGLGAPTAYVVSVTATAATRAGHLAIDLDPHGFEEWVTPPILEFGPDQTVTATTYIASPQSLPLQVMAVTRGSVHVVMDVVGVINHAWQVDGRVIDESTRSPIHPAAVGASSRLTPLRVSTSIGGRFSRRGNTLRPASICAAPLDATGRAEDTTYVPACLGGNWRPSALPNAAGTVVAVGDVPVPRAGYLSGDVVVPDAQFPPLWTVILERPDGRFNTIVSWQPDGHWTSERIPVGDWIVTVVGGSGTAGEVMHGLPPTQTVIDQVPEVLAAGATLFRVSAGATTDVGTAELSWPGLLYWRIEDPDGDYTDVTLTARHSSGLVVSRRSNEPAGDLRVRPGLYTVCAAEGSTTTCSGGGTSHDSATPISLESEVWSQLVLTLP